MRSGYRLFATLGTLTICAAALPAQSIVQYTESDAIIANPERGLQKYSITNSSYYTTADYSSLRQTTLEQWRNGADRVTVLFRYFLLDAFLESDISTRYLENIQRDFTIIRDAGLKCIVRFSYSNAQSSDPQQPSKAQILEHIGQLAPLLAANKDIILTHQAGLIGTWGEWYYTNSTEFGTDGSISGAQWLNRKEVLDAMLDATPECIALQVRYPAVKKTLYGSAQLSAAEAYQNTARARIGFYNDAFLNAWGDMGTYSVGSQYQNPVGSADYVYLANETRYTPMTGETNGLNPPRTDGANALFEMDSTNWTTLNRDYYTQNITNWINSGHFDDMLRGLGYRFVLLSSSMEYGDQQLQIRIALENKGFARMFKRREAWLVLRHTASPDAYAFLLDWDPRGWERSVSVSAIIDIADVPAGVYECCLWLPDPDSALAGRPEYAVRCANEGVWDAETGYNRLLQQLTVSSVSKRGAYAACGHRDIRLLNAAGCRLRIHAHTAHNNAGRHTLFTGQGRLLQRAGQAAPFTYPDIAGAAQGLYIVRIERDDLRH